MVSIALGKTYLKYEYKKAPKKSGRCTANKEIGRPGLLFCESKRFSSVQYATTTGFVHFCWNYV